MHSDVPILGINPIESTSTAPDVKRGLAEISVPESVGSAGKVHRIVIRARLIDDSSSND
jgi:hypothetical protein